MGKLTWWRCWRCGKKCAEDQVVWLLTGPAGRLLDGTPSRPEPYHAECAKLVPLERQWHPRPCHAMPTLDVEGRTVCSKCGAEYALKPDGSGPFHP